MSKALSANIHDPNHTADDYDIYFNGDIISGNGEHEYSANISDLNHTAEEYDMYFNGELIDSGGGGGEDEYDITRWKDGIPYNLKWCTGEYWKRPDATIAPDSRSSRTGYVNCEGASSITVTVPASGIGQSNFWFTSNKEVIRNFTPSGGTSDISVPEDAGYFALSVDNPKVPSVSVTPHA